MNDPSSSSLGRPEGLFLTLTPPQPVGRSLAGYVATNVSLQAARMTERVGLLQFARARYHSYLQSRIAARMCAMDAADWRLQTFGSCVKLFTTDLEKVRDLFGKLLGDFTSPAIQLGIAICYVFFVSPAVGTLLLTIFPLCFSLAIGAATCAPLHVHACARTCPSQPHAAHPPPSVCSQEQRQTSR